MKKLAGVLMVLCLALTVVQNSECQTEEKKNGQYTSIREEYGARWDLPDDYPIVKKNGVARPIEMSEYVFMKNDEQNKKINELSDRVNELEVQLTELEDEILQLKAASELRSQEDEKKDN